MSGAVGEEERNTHWSYSTWWVENQSDASTFRHTLKYRLLPTLQIGIEVNAKTGDIEPIATWVAIQETDDTPALIVGSGTTGIGQPGNSSGDSERLFSATIAKHIFDIGDIGVAPYASLVYLGETDEFAGIYGITFDTPLPNGDAASAVFFYDGNKGHMLLNYHYGRHTLGFILKNFEDLGVSYSIAF